MSAEEAIKVMLTMDECNTSSRRILRLKSVARDVITAAIFFFLSACGAHHSQYVYKLYPGPELTDSDVATLKFGKGVYVVEIDGLKVSSADYGTIKLVPGKHSIRWEAMFLVSVMVNSSGFDSAEADKKVNLSAGHTYTIEADRTTGPGYRMYLWIENTDTGEVVAGAKKP
jgi:hypothetical protein